MGWTVAFVWNMLSWPKEVQDNYETKKAQFLTEMWFKIDDDISSCMQRTFSNLLESIRSKNNLLGIILIIQLPLPFSPSSLGNLHDFVSQPPCSKASTLPVGLDTLFWASDWHNVYRQTHPYSIRVSCLREQLLFTVSSLRDHLPNKCRLGLVNYITQFVLYLI